MQQPNGHLNAPQQPGGTHAPNGTSTSSGAKLLAILLGAGVAIAGIAIGASQSAASPIDEPARHIDLAAAESAAVVDPSAKVDVGPGQNVADDGARVADQFLDVPVTGPNALIKTSGQALAVRVGPATRYLRMGTVATDTQVVVSCSLPGEPVDGRYGRSVNWNYLPAVGGFVTDGFVYTGEDFTAPDCRDGLEAQGSVEASVEGSDESVESAEFPTIPAESVGSGGAAGVDPEAADQPATVTEVVTTTAVAEPVDPETVTVVETVPGEPEYAEPETVTEQVVRTEYVEGEPVVQTEYVKGEPVVVTEYVEGQPQIVEVTDTAYETVRTTDTEYVVDTEWVAKTTTEHATKTVERTATVTATVTKGHPTATKPTMTRPTLTPPTHTLPTTRPTGTLPTKPTKPSKPTESTSPKPTEPEKPASCRSFDDQRGCAAAVRWATAHINAVSSAYRNNSDRVAAQAYGLAHSGSYSAIDHWRTIPAKYRTKGEKKVPAGGLAFFSGGGSGHVMVSLGDGKFLSTGIQGKDRLSVTTIKQAEKKLGGKFQGWSQPWFESNPH